MNEQLSEAFDLIRQYAEREGWIPIGRRDWTVGPWRLRVNGTKEDWDGVPPYHAMIEHADMVSFMCLNPFGGRVGGWAGSEDAFIAAMKAELSAESVRKG